MKVTAHERFITFGIKDNFDRRTQVGKKQRLEAKRSVSVDLGKLWGPSWGNGKLKIKKKNYKTILMANSKRCNN